MQFESEGGTSLLDEARNEALAKLGQAAGEDEYAVIAFSDKATQVTPLDKDLSVHNNAIQSLIDASYRTTDFYSAVRLAEDVLSSSVHQKKRIVLISDIQQTGWQGAFENWKLDAAIDFEIVSLGAEEQRTNNFVEGFSLLERRVEGRVVHRFNARR